MCPKGVCNFIFVAPLLHSLWFPMHTIRYRACLDSHCESVKGASRAVLKASFRYPVQLTSYHLLVILFFQKENVYRLATFVSGATGEEGKQFDGRNVVESSNRKWRAVGLIERKNYRFHISSHLLRSSAFCIVITNREGVKVFNPMTSDILKNGLFVFDRFMEKMVEPKRLWKICDSESHDAIV